MTSARGGNVTFNIGNTAARTVNLNTAATIGGNLSVTGGAGALTVNEATSPLQVGGNATITGGLATDVLNLAAVAGSTVGGNLTANKMNTVSMDVDTVGGSLSFNDSSEFTNNALTLTGTVIGGGITYTGGNANDVVTLAGAAIVGQSITANFGTQLGTGVSSLSLNGTTLVGGSLNVTGGNLGAETVTLAVGATLAGSANLNLGTALGTGNNTVSFLGIFAGSSFNYTGGAGIDSVTYQVAAGSARARFTANLGAGNDTVAFAAAPGANNPSSAFIDFGAGADSVTGLINFPFTFLNLP